MNYRIVETAERLYAIQCGDHIIEGRLTLDEAKRIVGVLELHDFEVRRKMGPAKPEPLASQKQEIA